MTYPELPELPEAVREIDLEHLLAHAMARADDADKDVAHAALVLAAACARAIHAERLVEELERECRRLRAVTAAQAEVLRKRKEATP